MTAAHIPGNDELHAVAGVVTDTMAYLVTHRHEMVAAGELEVAIEATREVFEGWLGLVECDAREAALPPVR